MKPPVSNDPPGAPPRSWQEHWFEHNQLVTRVYYDNDLAVYFDNDVDPKITWLFKYVGDVWRYTKKTYGGFGNDPRLFAIFHTNKYSGGHPAYYFDAGHDFRNTIDCGPGPWLTQEGNVDLPTHEVFHIVESASFNTKGSPGFGNPPNGIWGDSKFAEIYQYDVYRGLGLQAEAERWYNQVINQSNNNPKPGTYWFRDWFYPVYKDHGGTQVLVKFFRLLSQYFPKDNTNRYTRSLTWGEFFHFFSGAAGVSLKNQAATAFGWTDEFEAQFTKARSDFPAITY
ncbi:MAG: hypothetical protein ACOYXT_17825 [Bacteroidota bacterium]